MIDKIEIDDIIWADKNLSFKITNLIAAEKHPEHTRELALVAINKSRHPQVNDILILSSRNRSGIDGEVMFLHSLGLKVDIFDKLLVSTETYGAFLKKFKELSGNVQAQQSCVFEFIESSKDLKRMFKL